MFRLWGKIMKENHLVQDHVICNDKEETRTIKVLGALQDLCLSFDLGVPIWLDYNIKDFQIHAKTRFAQDNFVEPINFDYLEIHIIEED